jgi:Tol biopolymer transport system component
VSRPRTGRLAGACAAVATLALAAPAHAAFPGANGLLGFNSDRDGDFELFTMRADGSGQTQRTSDPASDRKPVWSPDGTRVAFTSNRDGDFDIYAMDVGGGNLVQVTNEAGSDFNPAWSPDGRLLAFNSDRSGDFEVYVVAAGGGGPLQLTSSPGVDSVVAFSPNGRWLAPTARTSGTSRRIPPPTSTRRGLPTASGSPSRATEPGRRTSG